MAGNVVDIAFRAQISNLEKRLKTTSGVTQAEFRDVARDLKKATREVEKFNKTAVTGGRGAAKSMRSTQAAASNLQAQLFDIGVGLQGGQNPLTILTQQGPQVAQAMTMAGGGVAALKTALVSTLAIVGPVAAAVGAAGVAWAIYTDEAREAARIATLQTEANAALLPSMRRIEDATIDLRVATGDLSEQEGALLRMATGAHRVYQQESEKTRKKVQELTKEQGSLKTEFVDLGERLLSYQPAISPVRMGFDALTRSSEEIGAELKVATAAGQAHVDNLREYTDIATEAKVKGDALRESLKSQGGARKTLVKGEREEAQALEQLIAIGQREADARLEGIEKVNRAEERQLAEAAKLRDAAGGGLAAVQAFEIAKTEIMATAEAERADIEAAADERARKRRERARVEAEREAKAITVAYGTAYDQIATSVVTATDMIAQHLVDGSKDGARAALGIAKAAGLAQVAIDTALAISKINATWAAIPPVAAALTGGAIAIGATQAATIAAQGVSFHSGGIAGGSVRQDEVPATLLRGEPVLTRQAGAMLGEQGVNQLNRGEAPGMGQITLLQQYGIRTYDAVTYDARRNPTTQLNKALRGRTKVGGHV